MTVYKVRGKQYSGAMITVLLVPYKNIVCYCNQREIIFNYFLTKCLISFIKGAQWLSGRVLDWRPKGRGFEPH